MNNTDNNNKRIYYLHELSDYKVADGDPDVRGWKVLDSDRQPIGIVDNLLVSKKAGRVRYLDVEVDESIIEEGHEPVSDQHAGKIREFVNRDGDTHLIVPIGMVRLDEEEKTVFSNDIRRNTFARTKRVAKNEPITPDYETYILYSYRGPGVVTKDTTDGERFYEREEFNDSAYRDRN